MSGGLHTAAANHLTVVEPELLPAPERLPWMPVYIGDYLMTTRGWSIETRAVYLELLTAQWSMLMLPADPAALRELVRVSPVIWRRAWTQVQHCFPRVGDGRRNPELHRLRREAEAKRAAAVTKARKAALVRWGAA